MHNLQTIITSEVITISDYDAGKEYLFKPYIKREKIDLRIDQMASQIQTYIQSNFPSHPDKDIILVSVINGAIGIAKQIHEKLYSLGINCEFDTYKITSRSEGITAEEVAITKGLSTKSTKDKIIIFIEDIIDTGASLNAIWHNFENSDAKAVLFASLFIKKEIAQLEESVSQNVISIGFEIQKEFIIGCWLDYKQLFRGLQDVWIMFEEKTITS